MPSSREAVRAIRQSVGRLASHPVLRPHPWMIAGGGVAAVAVTVSLIAVLGSSAAPTRPQARRCRRSPRYRRLTAPTPTVHRPTQLLDPFTGEPVKKLGRVLAVKIDNIVHGPAADRAAVR